MNCLEARNKLDDYFDGQASPADRAAMEAHAADCPVCRNALDRERRLRERLRRLPVPEPDLGLFERAMAAAIETDHLRRRRRWLTAGGALAAGVVLMIGLSQDPATGDSPVREAAAPETPGVPAPPPVAVAAAEIAGVTLFLNEEREVSLALESQHSLEDATFTVVLPEGIELSGYPGLREISWVGRIESGKNLLVLPLRAQAGTGGEITARVAHVERRKSVTLRMEVVPALSPPEPAAAEPITVM